MFTLPPAFDPISYRRRYAELADLRRSELRLHWQRTGRRDGNNASTMNSWGDLLQCLQPSRSVLEIGPFDKPAVEFLRGSVARIDYADYLDTDELVARAKAIPERNPDTVPPIRYVLANGGYSQIRDKYDAVVSQHCLEHQPDLIAHLRQVADLLTPQGLYFCSMPDRRRCFDRYLPPTSLINVLVAHLEARQKPPLESVIEHRCFTVPDWRHDADPTVELSPNLRSRLDQACREFQENAYVDVHCWKFTSDSLRRIMHKLVELQYLPPDTKIRMYNFDCEFAMVVAFSQEAHSAFSSLDKMSLGHRIKVKK